MDGEEIQVDIGASDAPTLLVASVTDALKTVSGDGFITGSVDRDSAWRILGFCVEPNTAAELGFDVGDADLIYERVVEHGSAWVVHELTAG